MRPNLNKLFGKAIKQKSAASVPIALNFFVKPPHTSTLSIRSDSNKPLFSGGASLIRSDPWFFPPLADILYDSRTNSWVGITYMINQEYATDVKAMCENAREGGVAYITPDDARKLPRYPQNTNIGFLEVFWASLADCRVSMAQVFTTWWYDAEHCPPKTEAVLPRAISIGDIDEVISLTRYRLPDFVFESIPWFTNVARTHQPGSKEIDGRHFLSQSRFSKDRFRVMDCGVRVLGLLQSSLRGDNPGLRAVTPLAWVLMESDFLYVTGLGQEMGGGGP
jgi:hypothetical protein